MKSLQLSIITIVGIGIIILVHTQNVYAPCVIGPNGTQFCAGPPPIHMTVKSNSMAYADDDKITISGTVDQYILSKYGTRLSLKIYDPKMVLYRSDQFNTSSNGSFVYSFKINGENATTGFYNFYLSPDLSMSYGSAFMYQSTPYDLEINGMHYSLIYALYDGVINKINANIVEKSITIHVVNASQSTLKIKLPRDLIDSKTNQGDTNFIVLADNTPETQYMQRANFNETQTHSDTRTLLIDLPFHPYSTDGNWYVKIIGTNMDLENKNPPVIITQVELASPFALFPDNQTCYNKPGFSNNYTCSTDLVPGHKVQCAYFIGSSYCEPIRQYTRGTNQSCFNNYPVSSAPQWFDVYNTLNTTIHLQNFTIIEKWNQRPYGNIGPYSIVMEMKPNEKCTVPIDPIDEPLAMYLNNMSMEITYHYNGKDYNMITPSLSDTNNDTRTWQLDGDKWVFAEQNTVTIPEFPFVVPVMLIGIISTIVFYRMSFRK